VSAFVESNTNVRVTNVEAVSAGNEWPQLPVPCVPDIKHHFVGDMGHVFEMGSGPTTGNIARVPEHIHRHISHTNRLMVHVMGGWLFGWFGGFVARQVGGRMGGGRAGR
jgi:hypothetical protein